MRPLPAQVPNFHYAPARPVRKPLAHGPVTRLALAPQLLEAVGKHKPTVVAEPATLTAMRLQMLDQGKPLLLWMVKTELGRGSTQLIDEGCGHQPWDR